MKVRINGAAADMPDGASVQDLIASRKLSPTGIIIELNGEIIRPEQRTVVTLKPDDRIEIIRVIGGG